MSDLMVPIDRIHATRFVAPDVLDAWIRPLIVEFIGPFALVSAGAGSILLAYTQGYGDGGTLVMVALAHGLAIGLMVAASGHISGGHFNPAVTVAMWVGGKIGLLKGAAYIAVQLAGAVAAALFLRYIFPSETRDPTGLGVPAILHEGDNPFIIVGTAHGFVIEALLTFFLVYVIHGVAVDGRGAHAIAPLAIGLTITMDIFIGGPLTGAAMNPARHFGPALVQARWDDAWLYWLAPISGGVLASILHNAVLIPLGSGASAPQPSEHHT
jgi:aquaporin TIP